MFSLVCRLPYEFALDLMAPHLIDTELKARIDAFLIERRKKPLSGVDELVKFDETASGGI